MEVRKLKVRDQMPELSGATEWLNGELTKVDLVGEKPTLIHFWSVSCQLCKSAMPQVNQFRDKYGNRLNVVAVHMPRYKADLDIEVIKKAAKEQGIIQPIFIDSQHLLAEAFKNEYLPAYYIFDKEGLLRHFQVGNNKEKMESLEKRLNHIVGEIVKAK